MSRLLIPDLTQPLSFLETTMLNFLCSMSLTLHRLTAPLRLLWGLFNFLDMNNTCPANCDHT